ncbi:MAG: hypothetical protein N2690_07310, partial [Rhodocyclaceae bacterium]|nr:hypothetical protein [Rhodocyclaceae bacterium]
TIQNFTWGSSGDLLSVGGSTGFLGAAVDANNGSSTLGVTIGSSLDLTGGGSNSANVAYLTDIQTLTSSNFGSTASATMIKTAASSKYVIIADVGGDTDTVMHVYFVETDSSNVATVTLVGIINEGTVAAANLT